MSRYRNPVFDGYFADPFAWKHEGRYYAVGTGPVGSGPPTGSGLCSSYSVRGRELAFPILSSPDLVHWQPEGGALRVPAELRGGDFWAPEVAYAEGGFHLYYSASVEELKHQLRVARSSNPLGPYEDAGTLMRDVAQCPFAIDPHPFRDRDGAWYLFYARDFLDDSPQAHAGTGLVVDRLESMTRLAGEERTVLRASRDWQLFRRQRTMYGRVFDWHTLEGPCVRERDGRYYCFYSGGCYENESYGVDYGVAETVLGPYADAGNGTGPRVLKTVPGRVIGPGHHSIVPGPDERSEWIVYHAWDSGRTARRLCIDRLVWTRNGPRCAGPTWTEQAAVTGSFV